jgi:hypothetical protein
MTWTLAYRKRTANRFRRVIDWAGSWADARDMAQRSTLPAEQYEIWCVPTADSEALRPGHEDNGNVLTDTGRRVRIVDNANIADLAARSPNSGGTSSAPECRRSGWRP